MQPTAADGSRESFPPWARSVLLLLYWTWTEQGPRGCQDRTTMCSWQAASVASWRESPSRSVGAGLGVTGVCWFRRGPPAPPVPAHQQQQQGTVCGWVMLYQHSTSVTQHSHSSHTLSHVCCPQYVCVTPQYVCLPHTQPLELLKTRFQLNEGQPMRMLPAVRGACMCPPDCSAAAAAHDTPQSQHTASPCRRTQDKHLPSPRFAAS